MNKTIFLSKLRASDLLSDDLRAEIRLIPKLEDKAERFLDDVILPSLPDDITNLEKLLSLMVAYRDDKVKKLAEEIRAKCYSV